MNDQPKIDHVVDEKIDTKIEAAKFISVDSLDTAENIASKTTAEQDLKSAAQRDINFTWEDTQKKIALFVVRVTMGISAFVIIVSLVLKMLDFVVDTVLAIAAFTFMSSTTSLVVGFYFSRTNHARIGDEPRGDRNRGGLDDR